MEELKELSYAWRKKRKDEARFREFVKLPRKVLAYIPAIPTVALTAIFSIWCTVIAFTGGLLPVLGWHLEGDFGTFLLWVFVADPIVWGIGYLAYMLVLMVVGGVLALIARGVWKVFVRD